MNKILIISQGEQAIRLHQAYQNLGYDTLALYSRDNQNDPYIQLANEAIPVSSSPIFEHRSFLHTYISIAQYTGCKFIHPGTSDLTSNYYFAKACELSDITLLGNLSSSIKKLKSIAYKQRVGRLHKEKSEHIEKPFKEVNILPINAFQLIYASIANKESSYLGSIEFYKRNSPSKNIYASSPCQSVQVDDFIALNRFCREIIQQLQLIGIVYFDFIFDENLFYLQSVTPNISPFSDTLENRVEYDFIEDQADIFTNGKIKYIKKGKSSSVSKNIFTVKNSAVKNIYYPGGCNIQHHVNAYKGKKLFKQSPEALAIITSYGQHNVVNKLMEATRSFEIETQ